MIISDNNKNNFKKALKKEHNPDLSASFINSDDGYEKNIRPA